MNNPVHKNGSVKLAGWGDKTLTTDFTAHEKRGGPAVS